MTPPGKTPETVRPTRFLLVILGTGTVTGLHLGLLHLFLWRNALAPVIFVSGGFMYSILSFCLQQWVFPRLPGRSALARLAGQTLVAVASSVVLALLSVWTVGWLMVVPPLFGAPVGEVVTVTVTPAIRQNGAWFYTLLPVVPSVLMTMLGYYYFWRPVHALQNRQRELADLAASAQLAALRAQINPHFLFNSLNSIAQLIHVDPDKAEVCVERLAEIFRYMLRRSEQEFVPLSEACRQTSK